MNLTAQGSSVEGSMIDMRRSDDTEESRSIPGLTRCDEAGVVRLMSIRYFTQRKSTRIRS